MVNVGAVGYLDGGEDAPALERVKNEFQQKFKRLQVGFLVGCSCMC